jgi:hypothetical protein
MVSIYSHLLTSFDLKLRLMLNFKYINSLNSFQAIVPLTGQEKGVLFYGGISP